MSSCKIYIACHKPCDVPSDDVYTPIQVGRSKSQYSLDMIGDDTGDNISDKNSTFCEMTAQYWVWKNVHDVDYVGFCHYRRFFNYNFTNESINKLFIDGTDVVVPKPQYRLRTMQHTLLLYVSSDDVAILRYVMHRLYPEYDRLLDDFLLGVKDYPYNMLVCKKQIFDEYSSWLFNILFECEKYIKLSPYSRGKRVFGYIAEFLMPLFFIKNGYRIKCLDVLFKGDNDSFIKEIRWQDKIKGYIVSWWSRQVYKKPHMYDRAHVFSLHNDGVPIDFFTNELTLSEIQMESLKILIDVHDFCISHGIKYSLAYGTLIGAVRHGGFIPWDDDIDIIMPRPEYERFCSTYQSDDYQLICKENDKTCMMAFAKVCDVSRTLATDSPWTRKKVGISIDVFPLDGAEDDFSQFASRYKKVQNIWMSLFVNRALQSGVRKENSAKLNLMIRFLDLTGLQSINRKLARHKVNEMDAAAKKLSFDKANHYTMMVFCDDGTRSYYDKKDFESLVTISFEGHDFCAFSGYDGILRAVFGDYMQLPPIEKRIPAHKSKFYWK